MGRIYLVRHGEVEFNRANAYIGRTDLPLNEAGRRQAELLAGRLETKDISAVYSSDLSRARETAEAVARRLNLPVNVVPEIREMDYGDWEGVAEVEVPRMYGDLYERWRKKPVDVQVPGGESVGMLIERAWPAFQRIAESCADRNALVVAHKCVNRVLLCLVMEMDPNRFRQIGQGNVAINIIEKRPRDGRLVVDGVNDVCHVGDGG